MKKIINYLKSIFNFTTALKTKSMTSKFMLAIVIGLFSISFCMSQNYSPSKMKTEHANVFTCPMHPEVTNNMPGDCPKCGMKLTESKIKVQADSTTHSYSCPMHPQVKSDKPGDCSKCGMKLTEMKMNEKSDRISKNHTCPMHPEVTSDKGGDCPKCGMKLIEEESKEKK